MPRLQWIGRTPHSGDSFNGAAAEDRIRVDVNGVVGERVQLGFKVFAGGTKWVFEEREDALASAFGTNYGKVLGK